MADEVAPLSLGKVSEDKESANGSRDDHFETKTVAAMKPQELTTANAHYTAGQLSPLRGTASPTASPTASSDGGSNIFYEENVSWEAEVLRAGSSNEKFFEEVLNESANNNNYNISTRQRSSMKSSAQDNREDYSDEDADCQTALLPSLDREEPRRVRSSTVPTEDARYARVSNPHTHRVDTQPHTAEDDEVDQLDTLDVESWQRQALKTGNGPSRKVVRAETRTGMSLRSSSLKAELLPRMSEQASGSAVPQDSSRSRNLWPFEIETGLLPSDEHIRSPSVYGTGGSGTTGTHYQQEGEEESPLQYIWELVTNFTNSTSVRGKQARLTLMEVLEHFDFLNDFTFICRVGFTIINRRNDFPESPTTVTTGKMAMVCLICIWLISAAAYGLRHIIIYHRIEDKDKSIFLPILVFHKIRTAGNSSPEVLYMFERLVWTYQLVMRLVEDIPQVVCSAVFLTSFGSDFYTHFMISYSCMLMVLTSLRMGLMYPIFGTLSLILSREPPVDSPVMAEAATTTKNFAGFMTLVFSLWTVADMICLSMSRGLWYYTFIFLTAAAGLLTIFFTSYWLYLLKQSPEFERVVDFHRRFDSIGTPRLADDYELDDTVSRQTMILSPR